MFKSAQDCLRAVSDFALAASFVFRTAVLSLGTLAALCSALPLHLIYVTIYQ